MSSVICMSSKLIIDMSQQNKKHVNILKAIQQYQEIDDSQTQQNNKAINQQQLSYQGFQNKKSLQIKPLNMFKDAITLKKQNVQKRQQVKNLQKLNDHLRAQYQLSINNNKKLQNFLKEVQFTFQQDHKKAKASDIILRARKTLFQQAKEANDKLKKMFKNKQASTIQQLKVYISTLENEKQKLKSMVNIKRQLVLRRMQEQDFNHIQIKQFQTAFEKVKDSLNVVFERMNKRRQEYRIQKMQIKRMIKIRNLQGKKSSLKTQNEAVKTLSLQNEGLQYQIQLLHHRIKDRKKQFAEYEHLKQRIQQKHSTIIQLEKQLREKNKTFDYMVEWTKQLRKQLQERKIDHARKKTQYQDQINSLSQKYERYNQIYKTGLFEQQVARRKGPKDPQPQSQIKTNSVGKQVTLLQIKPAVKSLSFQLFKKKVNIDKFIESLVKVTPPQAPKKEVGRRVKLKSALSIDSIPAKESITVNQLVQNIKSTPYQIDPQMIIKIARFVVEDGSGKAEQQASISIIVARQVFKKLLEIELSSYQDIVEATKELKKLLNTQIDGIRHQLKISGGKQEQINTENVKEIFLRYGSTPYYSNLFTELLQFYGWSKRRLSCSVRLQDFDELAAKIKLENEESLLYLIE